MMMNQAKHVHCILIITQPCIAQIRLRRGWGMAPTADNFLFIKPSFYNTILLQRWFHYEFQN